MTTLILILILIVAAVSDFLHFKIPNYLFPIAIVSSVILSYTDFLQKNFLETLFDFLLVFTPLLIVWVIGTLFSFRIFGAGDVKIISILPLFLSLEQSYIIFGVSVLLAIILSYRKTSILNMKESLFDTKLFFFYGIPGPIETTTQTRVAFAPYVLLATILVCIYTLF